MENLNNITNQTITKAWRGYGFFISFEFNNNLSLNIEGSWGIVKDGKDLIDSDNNFEEIDNFITKEFSNKEISIDKFETEEDVTIVFLSNGYELEMNNKEDDEDGWYVISEDNTQQKRPNKGSFF